MNSGTELKSEFELKEEYKEYTLGLALFDLVPVIIFLMSGIVMYSLYDSPLLLAGVAATFAGGLSKVLWKMIVVLRSRDCGILTKAFRLLMFGGFGLMILSLFPRAGQGSFAGFLHAITMMPAAIFYAAGFAGMCVMGYLGAHMDNSARSNWIEELVNTVAQTALLIGVIIVYFGLYYHGTIDAEIALKSTDKVKVTETEECYCFDGEDDGSALVFYPGAKVEASAYAPLMMKLAENGTDCFLCKMPLNFALLGKDKAAEIQDKYKYGKWFLSGHSLGGVAASMLAADDDSAEKWDGIVFLASYPTEEMDIPALSIYGSEDKVLNHKSYEEAGEKERWPDDFSEHIIAGGNHAQFGCYGEQKGDGQAGITRQDQQTQTAELIDRWIEAHD